MTDDEIIKLLGHCGKAGSCKECPIDYRGGCTTTLMRHAQHLLIQQKEEIATLNVVAEENNDRMNCIIDSLREEIKSLKLENSLIHSLYKGTCESIEILDNLNKNARHAIWEIHSFDDGSGNKICCSACDNVAIYQYGIPKLTEYCPHCGAGMVGEET